MVPKHVLVGYIALTVLLVILASAAWGELVLGVGLGLAVLLLGGLTWWYGSRVSQAQSSGFPTRHVQEENGQHQIYCDFLPAPFIRPVYHGADRDDGTVLVEEEVHQRIEARLQRLSRFGNVGRLIESSRGLERFVNHFLSLVMDSLSASTGAVWVFSEDGSSLDCKIERFPRERSSGRFRVVMGSDDTSIPEYLINLEGTISLGSGTDLPESIRGTSHETGAVLLIPLRLGGKSIGILELRHEQPDGFSPPEKEFAALMAVLLTLGMVRRRIGKRAAMAEEHLFKRTRELATLSVVGQIASSRVEVQRLLQLVLDISVRLTDSAAGILVLEKKSREKVVFRSPSDGSPAVTDTADLDIAAVRMARESGQPVRSRFDDSTLDLSTDEEAGPFGNVTGASLLVVPLLARDEHVGEIVLLGNRDYSEEEADAVSMLGVQAALSYESAFLYFELQKRVSFLEILYSLGDVFSRPDDMEPATNGVLDRLRTFADWSILWLFMREAGEQTRFMALGSSATSELFRKEMAEALSNTPGIDDYLKDNSHGNLHSLLEQCPDAVTCDVPGMPELHYETVPLTGNTTGIVVHDRIVERTTDVPDIRALTMVVAEMIQATLRDREVKVLTRFKNIILETITDGIVTFDESGKLTFWNRAAEHIINEGDVLVMGMDWNDILRRFPPIIEWLRQYIPAPEDTMEREFTIPDEHGDLRSLEAAVSPFIDPAIGRLGSILVVRDVTEIARLRETVTRVERVAALGEMAAGVAHEIRNPLGGIKILASYLARELPEGEPQHDMVASILEGLEKLERIVSDVLEFTHRLDLDKQPVRSSYLIDRVILAAAMRAEEKGVLLQRRGERDIVFMVDAERIEQVLLNLVLNAVDASPAGGLVDIEIAIDKDPDVKLCVKDQGPGVAPENRGRLFDPFYTTKRDGTGLGLAISNKIVEAHQGKIVYRDRREGGGCFSIVLPEAICQKDDNL